VRGVVAGLVAACAAVAAALALAVSLVGGAAGAAKQSPSVGAYRGLATRVDIFDGPLFKNPAASVTAMRARGVRALFLETANYSARPDLVRPLAVGRFIDAAHAAGIKVVAWYLPGFVNYARDLRRTLAAIQFRSATGQRFDSFALDIEASIVSNTTLRTTRLLKLSDAIRAAAGPTYPLGAIIPSPRGMQLLPKYWPGFPYAALADDYDVFLPMGYFSYRTHTRQGAYAYTISNVAIIRRATGDPLVPIHAIGGIANASTSGQVRGFVQAARTCGAVGASMYDFRSTTAAQWTALRPVSSAASTAGSAKSC
jgi:hypothetical protein